MYKEKWIFIDKNNGKKILEQNRVARNKEQMDSFYQKQLDGFEINPLNNFEIKREKLSLLEAI